MELLAFKFWPVSRCYYQVMGRPYTDTAIYVTLRKTVNWYRRVRSFRFRFRYIQKAMWIHWEPYSFQVVKLSEKLHPFFRSPYHCLLCWCQELMALDSLRRGMMRNLQNQMWKVFFYYLPHGAQSHRSTHFKLKAPLRGKQPPSLLEGEKWEAEPPVLCKVVSSLRGEPEPGTGSVSHVPSSSRPCRQLEWVWPRPMTKAHRAHGRSGKSRGTPVCGEAGAVIQVWSSSLCFRAGLDFKQRCQWLYRCH